MDKKQQNVRQAKTLSEYANIAFPRDKTVCMLLLFRCFQFGIQDKSLVASNENVRFVQKCTHTQTLLCTSEFGWNSSWNEMNWKGTNEQWKWRLKIPILSNEKKMWIIWWKLRSNQFGWFNVLRANKIHNLST